MATPLLKLAKIREIIRELPSVYPTYTFEGEKYVKANTYQYLVDRMKDIAKIVGVKF